MFAHNPFCVGVVLVVLGTACSGSVTNPGSASSSGGSSSGGSSSGGSSSGGSSGSSSSGGVVTLPDLTTPCDGNATLTGQSILDGLKSRYDVTFTPRVADRPQTSATAVVLKYEGGKIECARATRNTGGGAPDREAILSLEVRMGVTSQDGVLAESMPATVSRGVSTRLAFGGSIAAGDKKGTLELVPMPGYVVSVAINGSIGRTAPDALEGDVSQRGTQGNMGQVRSLGTLQ